MKKILITGANSYIGVSVENYLKLFSDQYQVDTIDVIDNSWRSEKFAGYDTVFHVAGIAHRKETKANAKLYYDVNRDLAVEIALKAKEEGVVQFIFLSSMSVYGLETGVITQKTIPCPKSNYGKSKFEAEIELNKLVDERFKIAILRPPIVYGKGCKGNYQQLRKIALNSPFFPSLSNDRSMIFIDHLSEFVKQIIDSDDSGLFLPQNKEYVCTRSMVDLVAAQHGKKMKHIGIFNLLIKYLPISVFKKAFGSLVYEKTDVVGTHSFPETIKLCEREE